MSLVISKEWGFILIFLGMVSLISSFGIVDLINTFARLFGAGVMLVFGIYLIHIGLFESRLFEKERGGQKKKNNFSCEWGGRFLRCFHKTNVFQRCLPRFVGVGNEKLVQLQHSQQIIINVILTKFYKSFEVMGCVFYPKKIKQRQDVNYYDLTLLS